MNTLNYQFEQNKIPTSMAVPPNSGKVLSRIWAVLFSLVCLLPLLSGQEASAQSTVIATISVTSPTRIAVNPNTNRIYVTNFSSNTVSVIDGANNSVVATIPVGPGPAGVGVNPVTNRIYVGHSPGTYTVVTVIDGATDSVLTTISTGTAQELNAVAVNPNTNLIYVTSRDPGGRVLKIDGATNTILNFISVAANPGSISLNPVTNRIYVGHGPFFGRTQITLIDGATNAVSDGPAVGLDHSGIGVNSTTNLIYVHREGALVAVDGGTNSVVATIPVGSGQGDVGVNPILNRVYVAIGQNDTTSVIDGTTNTLIENVTVGDGPFAVAVNPATSRIYVANGASNTISVIEDVIDTTAPVITPNVSGDSGNNGWYISDVNVTWTVTDPESGIDSSTGCDPATLTTDTTGTTLTCSATNGAGLSNSASVTIKLDKTSPAITLNSPTDGGSYLLNVAVAADYSCTDATSGVATCSGPVPSGNNIDTASVGSHSFMVNAADNAGLSASVTHSYSVNYDFNGFFSPIDNLPTLNTVNAGRAVPVKFSLSGDQGLNIFEAGYPKSQKIECDSSVALAPIEETVTAGSSSLSYDPATDQYTYVWKTEKSWSGTCRQLTVKLTDGTSHMANFNFTK